MMIDRPFLEYAYPRLSTADIARYLDVGKEVVRRNLLDHGITQSGQNHFIRVTVEVSNAAASSLGSTRGMLQISIRGNPGRSYATNATVEPPQPSHKAKSAVKTNTTTRLTTPKRNAGTSGMPGRMPYLK